MGLLGFLLNKWVLLVVGFIIMFIGLMPEYTLRAVRMVGMMGWAESRLGPGGTFDVWKIIGILAPIIAIIYFFTPSIQYTTKVDQQTDQTYQYQDYSTSDSYYQ
jgi:hypothetical protein